MNDNAADEAAVRAVSMMSQFLRFPDHRGDADVLFVFPEAQDGSVPSEAVQRFRSAEQAPRVCLIGGTVGVKTDDVRGQMERLGVPPEAILVPGRSMTIYDEIRWCADHFSAQGTELASVATVSMWHKALRYRLMLQALFPSCVTYSYAPQALDSFSILPRDSNGPRSPIARLAEALAVSLKELEHTLRVRRGVVLPPHLLGAPYADSPSTDSHRLPPRIQALVDAYCPETLRAEAYVAAADDRQSLAPD